MPKYVDGYLLAVPKKRVAEYRKIAQHAGKIWRKHGALEYRECVLDDPARAHGLVPFSKAIRAKPGETVFFSYVVYKSRAHRDRVNAKVMKDPHLNDGIDPKNMPFDMKRMAYGGFTALVDL